MLTVIGLETEHKELMTLMRALHHSYNSSYEEYVSTVWTL